ncbi:MAG: hypothetical protein AVDCRST_MAG57-1373, partial [uncultured Blastococcus sp.]
DLLLLCRRVGALRVLGQHAAPAVPDAAPLGGGRRRRARHRGRHGHLRRRAGAARSPGAQLRHQRPHDRDRPRQHRRARRGRSLHRGARGLLRPGRLRRRGAGGDGHRQSALHPGTGPRHPHARAVGRCARQRPDAAAAEGWIRERDRRRRELLRPGRHRPDRRRPRLPGGQLPRDGAGLRALQRRAEGARAHPPAVRRGARLGRRGRVHGRRRAVHPELRHPRRPGRPAAQGTAGL